MPDPRTFTSRQDQSFGDKAWEAALQADTAVRSASNLVTSGWANDVEAATAALFDHSPGDWLTHYKAALQDQLARDAYDASHRPVAVALGDALGLGLLARGGFVAGARGSAALPPAAKGQLGEGLSAVKTILQGDRPAGLPSEEDLGQWEGDNRRPPHGQGYQCRIQVRSRRQAVSQSAIRPAAVGARLPRRPLATRSRRSDHGALGTCRGRAARMGHALCGTTGHAFTKRAS